MTISAAWAVPAVFAIAIATMALLNFSAKITLPAGRMQAIDGLRGFLALSVFLHHAMIWQDFLHSGQWRVPASTLFAHLGQSSVSLFFMITACLFLRAYWTHANGLLIGAGCTYRASCASCRYSYWSC